MSTKISLPAMLDVEKYEPVLTRYNLIVLLTIALIAAFVMGVAVDGYYGY